MILCSSNCATPASAALAAIAAVVQVLPGIRVGVERRIALGFEVLDRLLGTIVQRKTVTKGTMALRHVLQVRKQPFPGRLSFGLIPGELGTWILLAQVHPLPSPAFAVLLKNFRDWRTSLSSHAEVAA